MDKPSTSRAIVVSSKGDDKGDVQKKKKPMDVQPTADLSAHFATDKQFTTREKFKDWADVVANNLGFTTVILKSDNGNNKRNPFVTLGCQRNGEKKAYVNKKREATTTLKCGCLFMVRSYHLKSGGWTVSVLNGTHNHVMAQRQEGHIYAERLEPEEIELVREMTKNRAPPRNILSTVRRKYPSTWTTIKHIYNLRQRLRLEVRGERTEMQQLLKCLSGGKYTYNTRLCRDTETISDIFFAHPESIKLFNLFHIVLVMESTYKTNKYGFPLLEFVGNTSTEQTFSVGFAFMTAEKEDHFIWALQKCRDLLRCADDVKVVVTDREGALMNAVEKVFPKATDLLCR
ncbi:protein FAR1-RELATED SEQUENCE 6, partial [Trifolium medium]|nr:protein FAR1-RELATED SEQUENCE 6 [Trifolium medium]